MNPLVTIAQLKADPYASKISLYNTLRQAINVARGEVGYQPITPVIQSLPDVSGVPELIRAPLRWSEPCGAGLLCIHKKDKKPMQAWNKYVDKHFPPSKGVVACCGDCAKVVWASTRNE